MPLEYQNINHKFHVKKTSSYIRTKFTGTVPQRQSLSLMRKNDDDFDFSALSSTNLGDDTAQEVASEIAANRTRLFSPQLWLAKNFSARGLGFQRYMTLDILEKQYFFDK